MSLGDTGGRGRVKGRARLGPEPSPSSGSLKRRSYEFCFRIDDSDSRRTNGERTQEIQIGFRDMSYLLSKRIILD